MVFYIVDYYLILTRSDLLNDFMQVLVDTNEKYKVGYSHGYGKKIIKILVLSKTFHEERL